jgi:L-galactose dehydrogenase/L-glyceraldehyde 3-phosphate reductase
MRHRAFGGTGLDVSEIGFGCGPTAGLLIDGTPNQRRSVIDYALRLGINYFDTAAAYGNGKSEANLGQTLAELSARPVIATKVTLEWNDLENISSAIEKSVAASLARLRVERLDVLHLHNRVGSVRAARSPHGSGATLSVADVLEDRGVVETLRRLQSDGCVGAIGCCAFGGEHEAVTAIVDSGAFSSVLINYSILNATAWKSAPPSIGIDYAEIGARAAASGMAVVGLRVLEGGLLSGLPRPASAADAGSHAQSAQQEALRALCEPGDDVAALAIRFAITNAQLATVLIGFSDEQQVRQAAEYARRGPLSPRLMQRIATLRATSSPPAID